MADPDLTQWWGGASNLQDGNQWTWIDRSGVSEKVRSVMIVELKPCRKTSVNLILLTRS